MTCPPHPPPKRHHSVVKILLISIAPFLVVACGESSSTPSRSEASNSGGGNAPVLPTSEAEFINVVSTAQHGSPQAENDMQRGGIKATRDENICRVLASINFRAEDWVGTVKKIDSNSDGKGVMAISLSRDLTLTTWNIELADISANTLIQPRTELFQTASLLKEGQQVAFSGTFIPDRDDCIKEASLTLRGKLDDPEFIFRFSSVARYSPTVRTPREERPAALPETSDSEQRKATAKQYGARGTTRYRNGDLEGAIQDYSEAIRLQPDDAGLQATLFNNRGAVRRDKGDLGGAIEDYNEAIRLKPDDAVAFLGRGTVRRKMGDLEGAIQDCDEAIRLKPGEALFFDNRGKARYQKGDLTGAIEDYTEAIRLKPDMPANEAIVFENRSEALRKRGDFSAAEQDHNRAIELGYVAPVTGRE
jgi:Flp pilus assembly protein TadD